MKSYHLFFAVSALALLLAFSGTASAKKKLILDDSVDDTRKLIHAVDVAAGTVTIETMTDQVMHLYHVDLGTVVKVNGATGNLNGVKVGMEVTDMAERDPQTLDSLSVGPASAAPAPPPSNKKGNAAPDDQ